jgi:hypothetical protein
MSEHEHFAAVLFLNDGGNQPVWMLELHLPGPLAPNKKARWLFLSAGFLILLIFSARYADAH